MNCYPESQAWTDATPRGRRERDLDAVAVRRKFLPDFRLDETSYDRTDDDAGGRSDRCASGSASEVRASLFSVPDYRLLRLLWGRFGAVRIADSTTSTLVAALVIWRYDDFRAREVRVRRGSDHPTYHEPADPSEDRVPHDAVMTALAHVDPLDSGVVNEDRIAAILRLEAERSRTQAHDRPRRAWCGGYLESHAHAGRELSGLLADRGRAWKQRTDEGE